METPEVRALVESAGALETFLSGMETGVDRGRVREAKALKPSLVEWKQGFLSGLGVDIPSLETYLSGMET